MRSVELPDGREVRVREAGPGDADALAALYAGLSASDRYRRFFGGGPPRTDWIERWVRVGERGGLALVAEVCDGDRETVIAEAGFGPVEEGAADLGITVSPDWRGWVGPYLLDVLVDDARAAGVTVLVAEVLSENRPMLRLLASRGEAMLANDDVRTVRVVIPTSGRAPVWPPALGHPRIAVEVPGGRWRGAAAAEAAGVHVVACPRHNAHCPVLSGDACPLVAGADLVVVVPRRGGGDDEGLLAGLRAVHPDRRVLVDDGHAPVETFAAAAADQWRWKCSTSASGPGKNSDSCPSSSQRTR